MEQASGTADTDVIARELAGTGHRTRRRPARAGPRHRVPGQRAENFGSADCVANRSGVVKAVAEYLYLHFRSHRLVAGNDPHLAAMPWREAGVLPRFGTVEPGEPVTLSYALLGVAEIGATVTLTGKANPRRTTC